MLFFNNLYSQQVGQAREDKVKWKNSRGSSFSIKSYYDLLFKKGGISFPWRAVWKSKTPSRVAFFAWEANHEAILTRENLRI